MTQNSLCVEPAPWGNERRSVCCDSGEPRRRYGHIDGETEWVEFLERRAVDYDPRSERASGVKTS